MNNPLKRIAILNRGEPAMRFIRALNEINLEQGSDLRSIVFYTHEDEHAPFTAQASESYPIGAAMRSSAEGKMVSAYCDHNFLLDLLKEHNCDAVWPGWGFISEDPIFVAKLEETDITFLGPSAASMQQLGDKIASKYMADSCDVPLAAWCEVTETMDEAQLTAEAKRIGFPLMVKASAGGGGRGIRKVNRIEDLRDSLRQVQDEVARVFGQGGILMEACIMNARHIEVQLVADAHQNAYALGVRDCSIQRRNQKVIEEAPSPILPEEIRQRLCDASERIAKKSGYVGVATAEFLYQPATGLCSFLEVNSRLQVEHTITEAITGRDLVKLQIAIAQGKKCPRGAIDQRGHAIELRLNAENPEKGFQPSPGLLRLVNYPSGPGIRIDSGVCEGMEISPHFDSMIAKVIIWGEDRAQAIARAQRACNELEVVVQDGATNQNFIQSILAHDEFVNGTANTAWLDTAVLDGSLGAIQLETEALIAAAILEYQRWESSAVADFFRQVQDGRPHHLSDTEGREFSLKLREKSWSLTVQSGQNHSWTVSDGGSTKRVAFRSSTPGTAQLLIDNCSHRILFSQGRTGIFVEVDGHPHPIERSSGGVLRAPSPALVVGFSVAEGDMVEEGQRVCTLEAMKMELAVFAPESGRVKKLSCKVNEQVSVGQPLLELEADGESIQESDAQALFSAEDSSQKLSPAAIDELNEAAAAEIIAQYDAQARATFLGFDSTPEQILQLAQLLSHKEMSALRNPQRWRSLLNALELFADSEFLLSRSTMLSAGGAMQIPAEKCFYDFCRSNKPEESSTAYSEVLRRTLTAYGVDLDSDNPQAALWRLSKTRSNPEQRHRLASALVQLAIGLQEAGLDLRSHSTLQGTLEQVARHSHRDHQYLRDTALQASYVLFQQQEYALRSQAINQQLTEELGAISKLPAENPQSRAAMKRLSNSPLALQKQLFRRSDIAHPERNRVLEVLTRRWYSGSRCEWLEDLPVSQGCAARFDARIEGTVSNTVMLAVMTEQQWLDEVLGTIPEAEILEILLTDPSEPGDLQLDSLFPRCLERLNHWSVLPLRVTVSWRCNEDGERHRTYMWEANGITEKHLLRNIHPQAAARIELNRLQEFDLKRIDAHDRIHAFRCTGRSNPKDERIFVSAEVFGESNQPQELQRELRQVYFETVRVLRQIQSTRCSRTRLRWNWIQLYVHPVVKQSDRELRKLAQELEPHIRGLGVQKVVLRVRSSGEDAFSAPQPAELILSGSGSYRLEIERIQPPIPEPVSELSPYEQRVVRSKRLKAMYPYELIKMLVGGGNAISTIHQDLVEGDFIEYDLNAQQQFEPVLRAYGENSCGVVCGLITNRTVKFPEGMQRVWIGSDATKSMGALAEPECRRILAALELAENLNIPVEWVPVSAGARIAMNSGTENLDWTARVLKKIIEFTQNGGHINVIVDGINVGAQSYWNAEATMLMHTRGVLIMTTDGSMVLTGKKALDFSGGVSAEDERGIGGAERIMGPNGQAQFVAKDLGDAYRILFDWYRSSYRLADELQPRRQYTSDPIERDVCEHKYRDEQGETIVGNIFDPALNGERKKPFAIRAVMDAVTDQDAGFLERFGQLKDGESAVVWETHIGGWPACLIGIESRPTARQGRVPLDGPDVWTGGTLFPNSSRKVARAINSASGNRPVVVLANLSGFDGSPESLRERQLELGAEIGRAVVNFDGPIIFVVIGRYHGGAYVVFSKALNENLTALAVRGSFASVIGGAPAAAVVFPREVRKMVAADPRIVQLQAELEQSDSSEVPALREQLDSLKHEVMLEQRGNLARTFDAIHSVDRAIEQGSLDAVIEAENLRPAIVDALSKSLKKHHRHAAHKASFQRIPALMSSTYYSLTLEER